MEQNNKKIIALHSVVGGVNSKIIQIATETFGVPPFRIYCTDNKKTTEQSFCYHKSVDYSTIANIENHNKEMFEKQNLTSEFQKLNDSDSYYDNEILFAVSIQELQDYLSTNSFVLLNISKNYSKLLQQAIPNCALDHIWIDIGASMEETQKILDGLNIQTSKNIDLKIAISNENKDPKRAVTISDKTSILDELQTITKSILSNIIPSAILDTKNNSHSQKKFS